MSEAEKPNPAEPKPEPEQKPWVKPPGYDPVDLDSLGIPEDKQGPIKERFNHLYVQVKGSKEENRELRKHLDQLTEAIDKRFVPLEQTQTEDREARLLAAAKSAREEGRVEDELKITKELLKPKEAPPEPKPKAPGVEAYVEAAQGWATERGDDGNLRRPWIQEDHPDNVRALGTMHKIRESWQRRGIELTPQTMPLFLNEIDGAMAKTNGKAAPTQAVLSTSQVRPPPPKDQMELSQDEKYVADRLYSHVKEPAKRYEAYGKSRQLLREQGRAR